MQTGQQYFIIGVILIALIVFIITSRSGETQPPASLSTTPPSTTPLSPTPQPGFGFSDNDDSGEGGGGGERTFNTPSIHHAAWVRCVSTGDNGNDSLLSITGDDAYKAAWIQCRNQNS